MSRYWGQNIVIDGSWYNSRGANGVTRPAPIAAPGVGNNVVDSYEYQVQEVLRRIANGSTVGKLVISLINQSPRSLRIVPVGVNQFGQTKARPVACFPHGCAGGATDSVIWFEPSGWGNAPTSGIDPGRHVRPEDVLLHEMFHALREMRGLFSSAPMGDGFDYVEEYYAILVANMYVSEVGRPESRRADHRLDFHPLRGKAGGPFVDTDVDFYMSYKTEADRMISQMPDFCQPLGGLWNRLPWNPIKQGMNQGMFSGI
jgi:hypothetical protein